LVDHELLVDTAAAADVAADDVGTVVVVGAAAVEHSIADTVRTR